MKQNRGKRPNRKIKEALSKSFGGCVKVNGSNWLVIEENDGLVTCENRKNGKRRVLNVA
ncbi:hypothetical protein I6N96_12695 [Enterococcus sp. BWM-S5]|uniref:DUF6906 domain-containing protein n=1 Tax=Enterococcus larvae TaxID=2794352 RepID=A0ABS4CKK6_9ENTE|nr:hypothetical protein [Enterococcus larvae]MBP1047132.1 hypothetical protein [Enterococcus larvae]